MGSYWGRQAFLQAKKQLGKPYIFGGNLPPLGPNVGTDCSGLVQWGYHQVGISLGRTTYSQYMQYTVTGAYDNGDLLFFKGSDPGPDGEPGHVGLFAGYGLIGPKQHSWIGTGSPKTGRLIVLNAPFTGDPDGIRFDYASNIGPVVAHSRPGNAKSDPK